MEPIAPPTFAVSINHPVDLHFSYRRYVVNQLRKKFGFEGVPVRVFYKARRRGRKKGEGEGEGDAPEAPAPELAD